MIKSHATTFPADLTGRGAAVSLKEKVVLITGATGPIGRRLVEVFASAGAQLAVSVRRPHEVDTMERALRPLDVSLMAVPCDLRYEEDVVRMIHRIVRRFGRIDVVVNAASVAGPKLPIVNYPVDPWRNILATNLTGSYLVCREVLPWMDRQGGGSIINVTSNLAGTGRPEWGAYFVSTHAIEGLTRLLASEHRSTGVRINCVDIGEPRSEGPLAADGADWAEAFLWLASDESASINGERICAGKFVKPAPGAMAQPN